MKTLFVTFKQSFQTSVKFERGKKLIGTKIYEKNNKTEKKTNKKRYNKSMPYIQMVML